MKNCYLSLIGYYVARSDSIQETFFHKKGAIVEKILNFFLSISIYAKSISVLGKGLIQNLILILFKSYDQVNFLTWLSESKSWPGVGKLKSESRQVRNKSEKRQNQQKSAKIGPENVEQGLEKKVSLIMDSRQYFKV